MQHVIVPAEDMLVDTSHNHDSDDDLYLSLSNDQADSQWINVSDIDAYHTLTHPKLFRRDLCTKGWKI